MGYDSIATASIPTAASNSKDFGKKKRVNRTAKLKQSKLDVRREQWLSQVKNKGLGIKEGKNVTTGVNLPNSETRAVNESNGERSMVKLEINVAGEGEENHYSDSDSLSNSPTSHTSSVSGSNRSVTAFTGSSGRSSSGSSSSSASGGFCSGSMTDEDRRDDVGDVDDDDDDCLDDWETMADALAAAEDEQKNHDEENVESRVHETAPEPETVLDVKPAVNFRAWRPDDTSRPQCLPNLLKQNSFPMKSGMCYNLHGGGFAPTTCPICCEDLDMTDSSFLPCPCGYRLCLFCYKRILEDNGRCPGCRKQYSQPDYETAPLKLARCYSMNPNPKH